MTSETEYLLGTVKNKERLLKSVSNVKEGKVIARDLIIEDDEVIDEKTSKRIDESKVLKG